MTQWAVRPADDSDRGWIESLLRKRWGSNCIVTRGRVHSADTLPAIVATQFGERLGLLTYRIECRQCEIVSLDALVEGKGAGTALLTAVRAAAVDAGCERLWLVTTNDNTPALRFFQKRGLSLVAIHRNQIERSRTLKPEIPETGVDGIPIRDELELEIVL